ncbi:hypothetical protein FQV24_0000440, partial [Spheniscus mendiculus]
LPWGYCHSLTIAHYVLPQELARVTPEKGVRIYQYIDDILIGGPDTNVVKFLGIWWRGGTVCIPPETLTTLEQVGMPGNKRELQHALGLLVFWRKHI